MAAEKSGSARQGSNRHEVRARALVAGLAPSVIPMIIRAWSADTMLLLFEGPKNTVDERWAKIGAGVLVTFKGTVGQHAERATVHGRIRKRTVRGIEAQLLALDDPTLEALRSLTPIPVRSAEATPALTTDAVASLCKSAVKSRLPRLATAFLDALEISLGGGTIGNKRGASLHAEFARRRPSMEQAIVDKALADIADCFSDDDGNGGGATGGLSLIESIDLRAALLVTETVHGIAEQLRGLWADLEPRLEQIVAQKSDADALAPSAFCHHFRDAIFFDHQFGALCQIDLTAGYSDAFIEAVEDMYRELIDILDRNGIRCAGG
jgi:hypothetical protein